MHYSSSVIVALLGVASVAAHGVITEVRGANGVTMPGLTVVDGTPRDCAQASCGSQDDTAVIRDRELGTAKASALGRTKADGPVDPARIMAIFMDGAGGNTTAAKKARELHFAKRQLLKGLLGGLAGGAGGAGGADAAGTKTPAGTKETGVLAATGVGASDGLPTTDDSGSIDMTLHQINQDGAGPFTAMVDGTSGGKDVAAFKSAEVTQNVPGLVAGLSTATNMDFPVKMQLPAGMVCEGQVGDVSNVCVAKLQNATPAGPFGGAVAFTQSAAAKKRAIRYNIRKRAISRTLKRDLSLEELLALARETDES
ncbi:MAS3 protein [Bisporella sp. PMI_857]|nr:MAS3 protein [Bisporella sp. PMI_857]